MRTLSVLTASALLVMATACSTSNPVGGSNTLTMPLAYSPAMGTTVKFGAQPVTLMAQNAVTTGSGALTYTFDVATDAGFATIVESDPNVAAGTGCPAGTSGETCVTLSTTLAGGATYYWRARAFSGSTPGPYTPVITFKVGPPIVLNAPQGVSPALNETVGSTTPTFTIQNAVRSGPVGPITYRFEVSNSRNQDPTSGSFTTILATGTVPETGGSTGQTSWTTTTSLPTGTQLYWHARSIDATDNVMSSYTDTRPFEVTQGIDLTKVVYVLGPNVSSWPQTATITSVVQGGGSLCIYNTMLGKWPSTAFFGDPSTQVEGNQWVFEYLNGVWYGGASDWYKPGQACKGVDAQSIGQDAFYNPSEEPLHSWIPNVGDPVGYMVTTPARAWPNMATLNQRSNAVVQPWQN
jgi:hypothetical protein